LKEGTTTLPSGFSPLHDHNLQIICSEYCLSTWRNPSAIVLDFAGFSNPGIFVEWFQTRTFTSTLYVLGAHGEGVEFPFDQSDTVLSVVRNV
jgi:hypothetical protein